jgi:fatty-acyl-CoA synthase
MVTASRSRSSIRDVLDRIFPEVETPNGHQECLIHDGKSMSYSQVGAAMRNVGAGLADRGLRPQDGVAILADNSPDYVIGFLAALYFGFRLTPLQVKASRETWKWITEASTSKAIITDDAHEDDGLFLAAEIDSLTIAAVLSQLVAEENTESLAESFAPPEVSEVAMISFTGGTTGNPKGVMQTYSVVQQNLLMELSEWPWPEQPRLIVTTPLSHGAGYMVLPTLYQGGAVITGRFSTPQEITFAITDTAADSVFLVPSLMYKLLDLPDAQRTTLGELKFTVYGASPILASRLADVLSCFGGKIVQLYGQTEAPMIITSLSDADHRRTDRSDLLLSCGRPVAGVAVRIVADGRDALVGEVGEIYVSGPLVCAGYWNNVEETSEAFVDGWLHTGDLAHRDSEGYLFLVGRSKEMFISGGFNIYPKEVEDVIGEIEGIAAVAVIGIPDPLWGEASAAFVVAEGVTTGQLQDYVRDRKGPILVPKIVEFIDSLPLTEVGKPDKRALRAKYNEKQKG